MRRQSGRDSGRGLHTIRIVYCSGGTRRDKIIYRFFLNGAMFAMIAEAFLVVNIMLSRRSWFAALSQNG
jgi:hypothetical protein